MFVVVEGLFEPNLFILLMDNAAEVPEDEGVGDEELFEVVEQDEGFEEDGKFSLTICTYSRSCLPNLTEINILTIACRLA